jgi:hypothetical protein
MPTIGAKSAKDLSLTVRVSKQHAQLSWLRKFPQISAVLLDTGLASSAWQPSISSSTASLAQPGHSNGRRSHERVGL